ncbi:N4-gp56 family major capsid protein (plasmid) [Staphylococcus aureus]|nr:N4-gp56 family major capsid protein [Staphylococcus aureus]UXV49016.1 N4-gp56 family major capsid protein [Staphylococcus aureus]
MTQTKKANLINPEVMADIVSAEFGKEIRFAPYAVVDNTLEGRAGDTITRPKYAYIGAAEDLTEGQAMDTAQLSATTTKVTVKEAGKATEITETAIITNVDGTLQENSRQLGMSLADKVDIDYVKALNTGKLTAKVNADAAGLLDAIDVFDSERELDLVLFINPKDYTKLVKSLFKAGGATQDRAISKGEVAELVGVSHIEKTKRLEQGSAMLQKV